MRVNIVCSKWGTRYGPHFVNRLKDMAKRNCNPKHDFHFYCYTDDAEGLDDDVKVIPFPDIPNIHPKYWFQKDEFKYGMARCWDRPKTFVFKIALIFLLFWLNNPSSPPIPALAITMSIPFASF